MNMHVSQTAQASAFLRHDPFVQGRRHVSILLCTHNGASYLRAQLDSYLAQDHTDWSLWVSDDRSTDQTREILQDFAANHPDRKVRLLNGIGQGHAANYLSLMCHPALPKDGFVALSDQDDVWLPDRLSRGMAQVAAYERHHGRGAVLYGGRTRLVGADMTPLGLSRGVRHAPSFHNALVQNVMAGNTLLMSPEALALVRRAGPDQDVPFHDWWLYLLLSGAGAQVLFDDRPTVLYRQHANNALGTPNSLRGAVRRLRMVHNAEFRHAIDRNLAALTRHEEHLTAANRAAIATMTARNQSGRLTGALRVWRAGVRRQRRLQSLFIFMAMLQRKV